MLYEPLADQRHVEVTDRRAAADFSQVVRDLPDVRHPEAEKVVLVMDSLNTHKAATPCRAFPPEQARRLAGRLEIHHTPKRGSWLNRAEIELSALATQRLGRWIAVAETLARGFAAWQETRN